MPTRIRPDDKPEVSFDPRLELSPFVLFLLDVREAPSGHRLAGSETWPGVGWAPDDERDVVLVDDDGSRAVEIAAALQERGFERVRALFGGLELYAFSLDPEIVGEATFLEPIDPDRRR